MKYKKAGDLSSAFLYWACIINNMACLFRVKTAEIIIFELTSFYR
jgi:hypothetical protein